MEIFLEECKNDKAREGSTVLIARTGTRYCPVGMVEKYLQHADLDLRKNGEAHLICRLVAIKNGVKAHAMRGIGYTRVREVFKDYVAPLESQGYNLGLHSMRAGGQQQRQKMILEVISWTYTGGGKGRNQKRDT